MWIVHALEKLSRKCRTSSWRKSYHNGPEPFALWGFQPSHYISEVPCLLPWLCLLCERTASYWARFEQACSRMLSLKPWWASEAPPSPPLPPTLLASSSSHHFRSALPILPVCLPGSIKDPCVGLVTSYPALKELQDQPFTDDSVLVINCVKDRGHILSPNQVVSGWLCPHFSWGLFCP